MRIYFARHGASRMGNAGVFQYPHTELGEEGSAQARQLARRLKGLSIQQIVSSPLPRARQTAAVVERLLQVPVEETELFTEIGKPSDLQGRPRTDPEVQRFNRHWQRYAHRADKRYADEETFAELKERLLSALGFLAGKTDGAEIAVITHGGTLRALMMAMFFGEDLEAAHITRFLQYASARHGGITVCEYTAARGWRLVAWNDHTHLDSI